MAYYDFPDWFKNDVKALYPVEKHESLERLLEIGDETLIIGMLEKDRDAPDDLPKAKVAAALKGDDFVSGSITISAFQNFSEIVSAYEAAAKIEVLIATFEQYQESWRVSPFQEWAGPKGEIRKRHHFTMAGE